MELLERDGEREALETAIAQSRSSGRVVVVAGEARIGKTALVARPLCPVGRLPPADHAAADGAAAGHRPPGRRPARRGGRRVGSQLAMLTQRHDAAIALGTRTERLARRIGDRETLAHALTNVGTSYLQQGDERGPELLEQAFALAMEDDHDDHAARAS